MRKTLGLWIAIAWVFAITGVCIGAYAGPKIGISVAVGMVVTFLTIDVTIGICVCRLVEQMNRKMKG